MTLWVVMPVFNEAGALEACLDRLFESRVPADVRRRIIIVDDASSDGTAQILESQSAQRDFILIRHERNRGKGGALRSGFEHILSDPTARRDDAVVIHDADLEYDPADLEKLLEPIRERASRVVYGSRFGPHYPPKHWRARVHAWGNRVLTAMSNRATGYRLTDMETCYKMMTVEVLRAIHPHLTETGFGIEPQITALLGRRGEPIVEVPISYRPRSYRRGKKIKWRDGLHALTVIRRERKSPPLRSATMTARPSTAPGHE